MAKKHELRKLRAGTVINRTSKKQESEVILALREVEAHLTRKFGKKIALNHVPQWHLKDIVAELRHTYPEIEFHHHFNNTSIRPDGGILFIRGQEGSG